ncbi:MAG TPA: sialidase family protein [Candidatus Thermoplasmatota archaeon]|nr:sialidase family protein [Candidatus Thermoplasmatota archaeon]
MRSTLGVAAALALVLLAGCSQRGQDGAPIPGLAAASPIPPGCDATRPAVAHRAGGVPPPAGPAQDPLGIPCLVYTGFSSGEPTIGVCPATGTVVEFPAGAGGAPAGRGAARSTDEGGNWTRVVPNQAGVPTHQSSLDPYLYLDPATCRLFLDDWVADCTQLSFSDDEGETWTESVSNCGQFDHQTIFAGPPTVSPTVGYPNVVYRCAINLVGVAEGSFAATCQKSLDGGLTWVFTGSASYVADPTLGDGRYGLAGVCDGATGHGAVGPDGTVYLPKGLCGKPMLAISKDEGLTWERVQVSDLGMAVMTSQQGAFYEHEAAVGIDAEGTLYYSWAAADHDGRMRPGTTQCVLDVVGSEPAGEQPPEYDNVTWGGYITLTTNALDDEPTFQSVALNDPRDPLVRGICGPIRCGAESDFLYIRVGPDGTPWASLVDGCIEECIASGSGDNAGRGVVGRLWGGPSLLG